MNEQEINKVNPYKAITIHCEKMGEKRKHMLTMQNIYMVPYMLAGFLVHC